MNNKNYLIIAVWFFVSVIIVYLSRNVLGTFNIVQFKSNVFINYFVIITTILLSIQGIFTLFWMLYAWEDPENAKKHKSPKIYLKPFMSFTALLPARHEEKVIKDTINAINNMNYPDHLKELLVICRSDDTETINKAQEAIDTIGKNNVRLIVFDGGVINKPHALNVAFREAKKDVVTIFDAEDEPHPDLYNVVNTIMLQERVDVVQSGVQLMNFNSHWFSALNVMEYFLWFKSGLHFFAKFGKVVPLGGNTVFFRKVWLDYIGGWDEKCLTEDADIGIRISAAGAKTRIVYDEIHSTREETPSSVESFIKQRTRWNQGFLQILIKGDWLKLPLVRQKILACYVLVSPMLQAFLFLYMPIGVILALSNNLPLWVSFLSFVPLYIFILQVLTYIIGLYVFTKEYHQKFSILYPFTVAFSLVPYLMLLIYSAIRAFYRITLSQNMWEKTFHSNAHRMMSESSIAPEYVKQT